MIEKEAGSTVTLEATFQEYTPFGSLANADPDGTPTITIYDPNGEIRVDTQDMTKSDTGQWYYNCQTSKSWPVGKYKVRCEGTWNSLDEVEIQRSSFKLT